MKKVLSILLLLVLLTIVVSGCVPVTTKVVSTTSFSTITSSATVMVTPTTIVTPTTSTTSKPTSTPTTSPTTSQVTSPVVDGYSPPNDVNWIYPSSLTIAGFTYGATAEYQIQVHNGNPATVTFSITARPADNTITGYSRAPDNVKDWVKISPSSLELAPETTGLVTIDLQMTSEVNLPKKWEFWISVVDTSQTGMLKMELCERWKINMR